MKDSIVLKVVPLGLHWPTSDPFLFCAHHDDAYPPGTEEMGPPREALAGRRIGMDFDLKDGWRMYHGDVVPGFPRHPHRGFETVTLARSGYIDHSDSLGATARFGHGDVQWMTAGEGIVHSEMFPLVHRDKGNRTELFQVWLNLPKADKLVEPHFSMLWAPTIPKHVFDSAGGVTEVAVIAGELEGVARPPSPPPHSWAARADSDVAIWTLKMAPGATWTVPPAKAGSNRTLYYYRGTSLELAGQKLKPYVGVHVQADAPVRLDNGNDEAELLLLQGRPLQEPVAHYGPFVMNSAAEIQQAINDYHRTQFGGWPWKSDGPVHDRATGRFAIHADGRREEGPVD